MRTVVAAPASPAPPFLFDPGERGPDTSFLTTDLRFWPGGAFALFGALARLRGVVVKVRMADDAATEEEDEADEEDAAAPDAANADLKDRARR